jgi:CheY-like chemotaxis protein
MERQTILLVDDDEAMRTFGSDLLTKAGYTVICAANGEEAVELYRERWKGIALVILDLVMPGMNGGLAFLEMKAINANVRAFFCTGYAPDDVIASLFEEEQLHAIRKPFQPDVFLKVTHDLLEAS